MAHDTYELDQTSQAAEFCPETGSTQSRECTVYSSAELHRTAKWGCLPNMRLVRWAVSCRERGMTLRLVCKARDGSIHLTSVAL